MAVSLRLDVPEVSTCLSATGLIVHSLLAARGGDLWVRDNSHQPGHRCERRIRVYLGPVFPCRSRYRWYHPPAICMMAVVHVKTLLMVNAQAVVFEVWRPLGTISLNPEHCSFRGTKRF